MYNLGDVLELLVNSDADVPATTRVVGTVAHVEGNWIFVASNDAGPVDGVDVYLPDADAYDIKIVARAS